MPDVIIMGGGPAGISAAVYTVRAGLSTLILASGAGSLEKTDKIENYYGFAEPISGRQLLANGIAQARRLGVQIVNEEVVGLSYDGEFMISTKQSTYRAPFAVMATGASRRAPKIPGLTEFEGKGVSYCAVCDGFFYRKKPVAVLGSGDYALHEAAELIPIASSVTVLTDGKEPQAAFPKEMTVETRKIAKLTGGGTLHGIQFEDGAELEAAGVFVAVGVAGSADLARKVGAEVSGVSVAVDEKRRTNVPGLYAAGDCTGGLLQISKAVCDGALAGTDIVREFRRQRTAAPSARM
jgi:thioredoxin reductase (NADPH)